MPPGDTPILHDASGLAEEAARPSDFLNSELKQKRASPRLMRYGDIRRITHTTFRVTEGDPLNGYLFDTPDNCLKTSCFKRVWRRFRVHVIWIGYIRKQAAWIIDDEHGLGFVGFADPNRPRKVSDRTVDPIFRVIGKSQMLYLSKEQKTRFTEFETSLGEEIGRVIGEDQKTLFSLDMLGVDPAIQGRGYGSALAQVVTSKADAHEQGTWLISSNVQANTGFYNRLGFFTVGEFTIGMDNPTWKGKPVVVAIMRREPNWKPSQIEDTLRV